MASIVSKLARAAAVTSRACPVAVGGGCSRPMAPRPYPIGWRRVCSTVSPAENKLETDDPKSLSVAAATAVKMDPAISTGDDADATIDPSMNLSVDARALESDETLWALYEYWNKRVGRQRSRAEMKRRFRITAEAVHKGNNSGSSIKCRLTKFADMRPHEMRRMLMRY